MEGFLIILRPLIQVIIMAIDLYIWAVIVSIVLTWLVHFNVVNTRNRFVYLVGNFLHRLTEPALRPIRRFLPNLGGIDISPVVLFLGLYFVQLMLGNILYSLPRAAF